MLRKPDVVEIVVEDWPGAVQWYTEKLGFQIDDRDDDQQWCRLLFPEGDSALALWGKPPDKPPLVRNSENQFIPIMPIIVVDDLEATVRKLDRRGVEFKEGIRCNSICGGHITFRITTFKDCEGNELQLIAYLDPSSPSR